MKRSNKTAHKIMLFGMFLVILVGGIFLLFWNNLPPQIPWFYSLPWGEEQLVDKLVVGIFIFGSILLLGITRLIGIWAGRGDETVENAIMIGGVTASILMSASFFRVMLIMGQL